VGDVVVDHPKTRFIAFIRSKESDSESTNARQGFMKAKSGSARGCRDGRQDAIIVAGDANLDDAATGVVQSAFGYQGQKCSACSRAVMTPRVTIRCWRDCERTEKIKKGDPNDAATNMSAVINEKHSRRITSTSRRARSRVASLDWRWFDGETGFFHRADRHCRREAGRDN